MQITEDHKPSLKNIKMKKKGKMTITTILFISYVHRITSKHSQGEPMSYNMEHPNNIARKQDAYSRIQPLAC